MRRETPPPRTLDRRAAAKNPVPAARPDAGLTLIELMISVLLAAILAAGLFYVMSGQSKTYDAQYKRITSQENLWGAMEHLQRQIRTAGYGFGGCRGAIRMHNGAGGLQDSPFVAFRAHNQCNLFNTNPTACPTIGEKPDSLTVTYADPVVLPANVLTAEAVPASPTSPIVLKHPGAFARCDLVALWSPGSTAQGCVVLRLTSDPVHNAGNDTYAVGKDAGEGGCPGGVDYNPPTGHTMFGSVGGALDARTFVARIGVGRSMPRHYAIDDTTTPHRLVTWMTNNPDPSTDKTTLEPVADGIEDMQIAWACDVNDDGQFQEGGDAATRRADEWAHNTPGDTVPTCGTRPIGLVRITLIARSAGVNPDNRTGFRPAAEDHTASPQDRFDRATLTTRVRPRNIR